MQGPDGGGQFGGVQADASGAVLEGSAEEVGASLLGGLADFGELELAHVADTGWGHIAQQACRHQLTNERAGGGFGDAEGAGELATCDPRVLGGDDERHVPVVAEPFGSQRLLGVPVEGSDQVVQFVCEVHDG